MVTQIWVNIGSGNEWFVAWWHQAITQTNLDLLSNVFHEINLRAYVFGSGHKNAAVLLPGFAINL